MLFENINPFVRQALIGNLTEQNASDIHTNIKTVDARLFYIISGSGSMIIEGEEHPLVAGTAILFSAGTEYIWQTKDVKYYAVNFDYTMENRHIQNTFHPILSSHFREEQIIERPYFEDMTSLNGVIVLKNATHIQRIVEQITTEYSFRDSFTDALLSALLKSVIIAMVRQQREDRNGTKGASSLVREMIEYLNDNYEKKITNDSLSAVFHFNSSYMNRIFKEQVGVSIHDFLIARRISVAMEMLRSQNIPIGEIALKCGFGDMQHFTKTFRKRTNVSPREFRQGDI